MLIANPIYDVVFKRLMENDRVAKFFVGTLLNQEIESLHLKPQEYTYEEKIDYENPKVLKAIQDNMIERLSIRIFRMDFVATIRTESGELKKILIEIQKAENEVDLMRFRNYLAEQYKKTDKIDEENVVLPITTIYILGFKLPEILSPCIKVERVYKDLITETILEAKNDFIEKLTHDSFVVQVGRITDRFQTRLDKLLSVFEQRNFVDEKRIVKEYFHENESEELKEITDILHYSGISAEDKQKIEAEHEFWRTLDAVSGGAFSKAKILEKKLKENEKILEETKKNLEQKDQVLEETKKNLEQKDQVLEETKKNLEQKDQVLEETKKALEEQARLIEELKKQIHGKK